MQDEMARLPAGARTGAATFLSGRQKFVAQKRILRAGERVPIGGIDCRDAVEQRSSQR
jgi:hypothetical protein